MTKRMTMRRTTLFLVLAILVFSLSGCGWWKDLWYGRKPVRNQAEALYQAGVSAYQEGRYKRAVEHFTRVRELFPLHELALMAEIGVADAHFSDEQYLEAELAYTDFIMLHPTNENVPYAMYQIGLCNFNQMQTMDRDQTAALKTAKEFERLIARFPSSKFAFMAEKKLRECRQRLAEHEFYVGEFYFKRELYKAAINRFEYLAKNYPSLGFDYQTTRYLDESRRRLQIEEEKKAREEARKAEKAAKKK
jgi:outer membrane protein assembly factor BamD